MADTTFTDGATLVVSAWLQDINNVYYRLTANRIPYATGSALTTSANLTFNGTTLTAHTLTVSTGALTAVSGTFSSTVAVNGATIGNNALSVLHATANEFAAFVRHSNADPNGFEVIFTTDTNDAAHPFFYAIGNATVRANILSNGGLANFQANNQNLSDERSKSVFEDYDDALLDALEEKFLRIRRGRYKYKDQTHNDWNYGRSANSVAEHIPELSGVWNETKRVVVDGKEKSVPTPKDEQLLCEYPFDLSQIGEALLVRALKRLAALEARH